MDKVQILLVILIALIAFAMLYVMATAKERNRRERALSVISGQSSSKKGRGGVSERDKRLADLAKKLKETEQPDKKNNQGSIKDLLVQAGFQRTSPLKFWLVAMAFGTVSTILAKLIWGLAGIKLIFVAITLYLGLSLIHI